ncbi:MAG: hypothetical protein HOQ24_07110 [Mycobacteriaceae bacterium]|nr:hypothetical protein [Mycobacteriaceae bacterium]
MIRGVLCVSAIVAAGLAGTAAAAAGPQFTPEAGGWVRIDVPPGEWWKCGLYNTAKPGMVGPPPIVNDPSNRFMPPGYRGRAAQAWATPSAHARFTPGATVVADCVSRDAPFVWLQTVRAGD